MSEALYKFGGLRFWSERQIMLREQAVQRISHVVTATLSGVNPSWTFVRCEGPQITPLNFVADGYGDDDVWMLSAPLGEGGACLRPETTASSYLFADKHISAGRGKLPLCVWQAGKSFRREQNDGASASKLRFYEFWQLEFQCIYAEGTKANYRERLIPEIQSEIAAITGLDSRVVPSDRLPAYSEATDDVEVFFKKKWIEMCSISTRTDNPRGPVLEVAVGLDRIVSVMDQG